MCDNYNGEIACGPGRVKIMRENEASVDAFIVAWTCDVNIDILREMTEKPVAGIGESSMMAAMMLRGQFSVIQLGPRGIRANCICPGLIETPLWHIDGEPYPRRFRNWVAMTPHGRAGKPEEVASLAAFLAGEGAAFINGPEIAVDGGFCVGMRFEDMETD